MMLTKKDEIKRILDELMEEFEDKTLSQLELETLAETWIQCGIQTEEEFSHWFMMGYIDPLEVKHLKEAGVKTDEISSWASDHLPQIFGESVEYELMEYGKEILLELLRVQEEKRGKGYATWFLTELCRLADETLKTIRLTPSGELGSELPRLIRLYERFDFVQTGGEMIRQPKRSTLLCVASSLVRG